MQNAIASTTGTALKSHLCPADGFMDRFEEKFFVPYERLPALIATLKNSIAPDPFHRATAFNCVQSLYFDSGNFAFFRDHVARRPERVKMRVRSYGRNGEFDPDGELHLEIKEKIDTITKKARFEITQEACQDLMAGRLLQMSRSLVFMNAVMGVGKLKKRIDRANALVEKYRLVPIERVKYCRKAFEEKGVRLTVDWNLELERLQQLSPENLSSILHEDMEGSRFLAEYARSHPCIVEVKHKGVIPWWVTMILDAHGAERVKFSKYVYGVAEQLVCEEGSCRWERC